MSSIQVIIHGHIYDVTNFIPFHPGEGLRGIRLKDYHNKDVTDDFEYYHETEALNAWLAKIREKKSDEGIVYVGKNDYLKSKFYK